jgi:hypothetical protein
VSQSFKDLEKINKSSEVELRRILSLCDIFIRYEVLLSHKDVGFIRTLNRQALEVLQEEKSFMVYTPKMQWKLNAIAKRLLEVDAQFYNLKK